MGRVFSYEAVAAGQVPQPDDFAHARKLFAEYMQSAVESGAIDGGFIFGSVGRGTQNMRSDFDTVIALGDGSKRSYDAARDLTQTIVHESGGKILIEPIVYSKQTLASGNHEIDRLFGQHLLGDFRQVEGNDPASYIVFSGQSARDIVADYVFQKARKLSNIYATTDPNRPDEKGLQRMLELPNSLGRKALNALADIHRLEASAEASEKPAVFRQSDELFREIGMHDGFCELSVANDEYTEILQQTIDGTVGKETYDDTLKELHGKMPLAIEWLRAVGDELLPLFD